MAARLCRDRQIREAFDRVCWLSVGKADDALLPLQRSLFQQLTGGAVLPAELTEEARVLEALRQAASGQRVLLVLDDLTSISLEKALNPLSAADPERSGRLVCTTQIQRLLGPAKGYAEEMEVGALSPGEAAWLLLEIAGLAEEGEMALAQDEEEESKRLGAGGARPPPLERGCARRASLMEAPEVLEIVELCSRLPIAVAIAGGSC